MDDTVLVDGGVRATPGFDKDIGTACDVLGCALLSAGVGSRTLAFAGASAATPNTGLGWVARDGTIGIDGLLAGGPHIEAGGP